MKREFLEGLGLEKTAIDQILDENSRDIGRWKQKAEQAEADKATIEQQLADRDKDIEELKAADADGLKKQLEELQSKYTTETEQYKNQLADRDYMDAVKRAIAGANGGKGIKFSSKAAEKAYLADLKANRLEMKDGDLVGFDDYHKAQVDADPSAFQSDKPVPMFSKPVGIGAPPANESKGAMYAKQFNAQYTKETTTNKE